MSEAAVLTRGCRLVFVKHESKNNLVDVSGWRGDIWVVRWVLANGLERERGAIQRP
jgi:hypothetical protein